SGGRTARWRMLKLSARQAALSAAGFHTGQARPGRRTAAQLINGMAVQESPPLSRALSGTLRLFPHVVPRTLVRSAWCTNPYALGGAVDCRRARWYTLGGNGPDRSGPFGCGIQPPR